MADTVLGWFAASRHANDWNRLAKFAGPNTVTFPPFDPTRPASVIHEVITCHVCPQSSLPFPTS